MTREEIRKAIHAGVRAAELNYKRWSKGWTLRDSAIEGLIVAEISRKLGENLSGGSLLFEVPVEDIQRWSGAEVFGRKLDTFKGRKRADIVLFNRDGRPTCMIEVKRRIYGRRSVEVDLHRLSDVIRKCALMNGGTLQRGMLAVYHDGRRDSIESWIHDFFSNNKEVKMNGDIGAVGSSVVVEMIVQKR